jgi:hypothetical protein
MVSWKRVIVTFYVLLHVFFYLSFFEYKFHIMEGLTGYLIAYVDNVFN